MNTGVISHKLINCTNLGGTYRLLPMFYTRKYIYFANATVSSLASGRPINTRLDIFVHHTQDEKITTNIKATVYLTSPTLSTTNVVAWNFHVDDSDKGRYNMILSRDLLR